MPMEYQVPADFESILLISGWPKYIIRERDHPFESELLYKKRPSPSIDEDWSSIEGDRSTQWSFSPQEPLHNMRTYYSPSQDSLIKKMRQVVFPEWDSQTICDWVTREKVSMFHLGHAWAGGLEKLRNHTLKSEQPSTEHIMFGHHKDK